MKPDFREAARFLASNRGFAAIIVLTLGLAIGVNSTIFSVLNGVLLRPLAYAAPDSLVGIWESNPSQGLDRSQVAAATYLDWRDRTRSFTSIGLSRYRGYTLTGAGEPERLVTVDVSPVLFRVLGVAPLLGRTFTDEEEHPGTDSRKAVLSHGAWVRRFGQDPNVLGKTMTLDDATHTIVGVMPRDFQYPASDPDVELWSPLTINLGALASRPHRLYHAMGRLAPGITIEQARGEMAAVSAMIARENPDSNKGWGVTLVPAHEQVVGKIGDTLWVLFGAVVLVLVIACANIANLMLARSSNAARGFALCAAFGASRWALVRRSLVESAMLSAAGGTIGLLLAWWGTTALRPLIPPNVPRAYSIGLDLPVLAFTATATIVSGLLVGLVPAWRAMRPNLLDILQDSSRGSTSGRSTRRLSNVMVAAEVALALMLLVSAGLLIRSFARLNAVDPGYRTSGIVAAHVVLPNSRYPDPPSKRRFFDSLVARVKALPGVDHAAAVSALPMSPLGVQFDLPFTIEGLETSSPTERPRARYRAVVGDYFQTMAIELKKGRLFDDFDGRENGPKVAVVNESVVRRYFSKMDPIGQL
ncbi:MAG: ABC transporter permease, partial [Vicinamibacterales bacterium]